MEEEYILTIKNLEVRIRHLEEEKRGFKEEIRDLIVKQEELKFELAKGDERLGNEVRINRKLQNMIYEEDKQVKVEEKRERRGEKGPERRGEEEKSLVVTRTSNA
jgi:regulator of replication initiation timing